MLERVPTAGSGRAGVLGGDRHVFGRRRCGDGERRERDGSDRLRASDLV
ncbi:hypothetical protein ACLQ3D_25275 [Micromonospora vinacea]|uniref:Uncharacterized protein n=1 Tax=Micromonospora vinacea TaxID=709878 RepID=A0ABS0K7Z7_9ACTN|nr:hypothetical protein [Micromonospora vinacea]MBG6104109.1 hypothetical protein [Micromonospora vinacea]WTA70277.1 hypothetical protein OHB51_14460 [Micromonospora sp. NBC_00855]